MSLGTGSSGATSSGNRTADVNALTASMTLLWGAKLLGGTADSRLKIYNAATVAAGAASTLVWELAANAGAEVGDTVDQVLFEKPILCSSGISTDISGAAAEYYVIYEIV